MVGVGGQVEQLVGATEHDLDLLDRAAIAGQVVVDPAADEARAELGERPVERRALADDGRPVLERDGRGRQLLEARDLEARVAAEVDLERAGEERLGGVGRGRIGRDQLLEDGRRGAVAERDDGPRQERPIGRAGPPADDDRPLEADAVGDVEDDALRPQRPGQLREPVVGREGRAAVEQGADASRVARDARSAMVVSSTPAAVASGDRAAAARSPSSTTSRPSASARQGGVDARGPRRPDERRGLERDRAQVDVGRVQQVRLGRQRLERVERGAPVAASQSAVPSIVPMPSRSVRATGREKSVRPRRAGRGRPGATVIRATPPSRA